MTDPTIHLGPEPPSKVDPNGLTPSARPQALTRINRRVLIGVVMLGSVPVFGAVLMTFDPPSFRSGRTGEEIYNVDNEPTPDELATLPRDCGENRPPQLGAPLPGDLGGTVLKPSKSGALPSSFPCAKGASAFAPTRSKTPSAPSACGWNASASMPASWPCSFRSRHAEPHQQRPDRRAPTWRAPRR